MNTWKIIGEIGKGLAVGAVIGGLYTGGMHVWRTTKERNNNRKFHPEIIKLLQEKHSFNTKLLSVYEHSDLIYQCNQVFIFATTIDPKNFLLLLTIIDKLLSIFYILTKDNTKSANCSEKTIMMMGHVKYQMYKKAYRYNFAINRLLEKLKTSLYNYNLSFEKEYQHCNKPTIEQFVQFDQFIKEFTASFFEQIQEITLATS